MQMKFGRNMAAVAAALAAAAMPSVAAAQLKIEAIQTNFLPASRPAVAVAGGQIGGITTDSGVDAFLGIPYAAPPVGPLRWRPPQPPVAWRGIRPATTVSAVCTQGARGPGQNHYFGPQLTGEDCLYINVWAPAAGKMQGKLPVVVYIHGGGYQIGSGSHLWARGEALAGKGVVAVSFNYRLGSLGFLAHPQLTAEAGGRGSGNYGLMDQIAALKWLKQNAAKFGGDPDNVTIMGQSAGSMALSVLAASPEAAGLFQREIGMSGTAISSAAGGVMTQAEAEKNGLALQQRMGARDIEDLRLLPPDQINVVPGLRFGPNVDGRVLPDTPTAIFKAGKQNDVGLVLGFTHDESFNGLSGATSAENYVALARRLYPDNADQILKLYPANADWRANATAAGRDLSLGLSMWDWAALQTATGKKPVYAYLFSRVHPYAKGIRFIDHDPATAGAYHSGEIVYFTGTLDAFNTFRHTRDWSDVDLRLSEAMVNMVVAYARTGNPVTSATPFVRFDPANARMLELGDTIRVIDWPNRANYPLLRSLPAPRMIAMGAVTPPQTAMPSGPKN